jgi:hypothetical protein
LSGIFTKWGLKTTRDIRTLNFIIYVSHSDFIMGLIFKKVELDNHKINSCFFKSHRCELRTGKQSKIDEWGDIFLFNLF